MLFSIVTPTYNRAALVCESIASYLAFIAATGAAAELIVVDDASTDSTLAEVGEKFTAAIAAGQLKMIPLAKNVGWTNARTEGVRRAQGKWIIFTDSDDLLNAKTATDFVALLAGHPDAPIIFTRCVSRTQGTQVGPLQISIINVDAKLLLTQGTPGECMATVQRRVLEAIPFNPQWQGFENITFAQQLQQFGSGIIAPLAVRIYGDEATGDRLSLLPARIRRARSMVYGNRALVAKFWHLMSWRQRAKTILRLGFYLPFYLLGQRRA